ncbi:MAG: GyrI-like domain-containing protein [Campylobacter sp.]
MQILRVKKDFEICGRKAQTSNFDEINGRGEIANLWGEFLKFGVDDTKIYATKTQIYDAYFDYKNGADGEYSVLVGTTSPFYKIGGEICEKVRIKAGDCAVFRFLNDLQNVAKFWCEIWKYFENSQLKRAYKTDFEKHCKDKMQIYISIK